MNLLESLKAHSVIVADTGDIELIAELAPQDATTNPSLLFKAAQQAAYRDLVDAALAAAGRVADNQAGRAEAFIDHLFVAFGVRILALIPGRVSTEVDARLSFDTTATVAKARHLIGLYEAAGIARERVLIKIASTWEGIRAAELLEAEGIHCNLTLLFSFAQAAACAAARVTLISPFVGRIYDWHKADRGVADIALDDDPGVASVTRIFNYYKRHGFNTQVMGASFRKAGQITGLAGCDLLTISPGLINELRATPGTLSAALSTDAAQTLGDPLVEVTEAGYRWHHNQDPMAVDKLSDGIRRFDADARKLERYALSLV